MIADEISTQIRAELARLCNNSKQRSSEFSRERPTRWSPGTVVDPRCEFGNFFTPLAAWNYIEERLLGDEPVEVILLDRPPGKKGYVMKIPQPDGQILYIKLQLCAIGVHGRSFHYSNA